VPSSSSTGSDAGRSPWQAGAGFDDVVRLTFSVTDWEPAKIDSFMAGVSRVADAIGPWPRPGAPQGDQRVGRDVRAAVVGGFDP
jgi:hypothetical protein